MAHHVNEAHMHEHHDSHSHDPNSIAHPLPLKVLVNIFVLLMVLTFLTVAATWVDLGDFNVWIALIIAFIKAAFVCLYFMHLRYDSPLYSIVLVGALLFVSLFIGIVIVDSHQYEGNVNARTEAKQPNTPIRVE